jgi:hypothetical protein
MSSSVIVGTPAGNRLSRNGEASRVRQLKSEIEVAVRVRSKAFAVRLDEIVSQRGKRGLGASGQHQLIRIGPAVVADRNRFAAPDQLRAA